MKSHYDILAVPPSASVDEIKHAFRREISRYHPDKVQHLGAEFQQLAAVHAAELTKAYTVLMDKTRREEYDLYLSGGGPDPVASHPVAPPPPAETPADKASGPSFDEAAPVDPFKKPDRLLPDDFLRKASLERLRDAVTEDFPDAEPLPTKEFDFACTLRSKRALFKKAEGPVTFLARYVATIDASAIDSTWSLAVRYATASPITRCVLLMGMGLASAPELAGAISEQRRRHRNIPIVVVPLDVHNWAALVPADTPPSVKAFLERLRAAS